MAVLDRNDLDLDVASVPDQTLAEEAIVAEGAKALVGYEREKALANTVLLSEIPTTYDRDAERQVNAGNLLLRGVPGIGKTFFAVKLEDVLLFGNGGEKTFFGKEKKNFYFIFRAE